MILSDYHVHTNYADGKNTPEEMVVRAIELGMKTIGFSEHSFVTFDTGCRMEAEQTIIYRNNIDSLKQKYGDKIEILCGIEMDYDSGRDLETGFVENPSCYDYVIGSVHYLDVAGEQYSVDVSPEETRMCVDRLFGGDYDSYAECYYEKLASIPGKWSTNIVGHFDLITKFLDSGEGPDITSKRYKLAWQGAMDALYKKCAFEINMGAVVKGYRKVPYMQEDMLQRLKSLGGSLIISGDCHSAQALLKGFDTGLTLAESAGFTELGFTDNKGTYYRQYP